MSRKQKTLSEVLADQTMSHKDKHRWYTTKSEEWKQIRQIILDRDNHHCMCCGRTEDDKISGKPVNLAIHHNNYKVLFHEMDDLSTLITLCQLCHKQIHDHLGNKQRFRTDKADKASEYTIDESWDVNESKQWIIESPDFNLSSMTQKKINKQTEFSIRK